MVSPVVGMLASRIQPLQYFTHVNASQWKNTGYIPRQFLKGNSRW